MGRSTAFRPPASLAAVALCVALSLPGCGKEESANGKLLIRDKIKVASTEFALARAHDFDRACESLYLKVPLGTLLRDATEQAHNAFAAMPDDLQDSPTTVRRWDYVLMHDQQRPETYESLFIGEWRPARGRRASAGPDYALVAPLRCIVSQSTIAIYELEPPFVAAGGDGSAQHAAAIVTKYSRVPAGLGESIEQRTRDFATSDKANVGEAPAVSLIIKEGASQAAPAVSGSSTRK